MRFLWFWTFWHWSTEGFRSGVLLRGPLLGVGGHWDEWFRHEASADDRRHIAEIGRDVEAQRQFVVWVARQWAREAAWQGDRPPVGFVLGQLAQLPPFDRWPAFDACRTGYGRTGIAAVILAEGSRGEASDVYPSEAVVLPAAAEPTAETIVPDGFRADAADLDIVRQAARSQLGGRALAVLVALWLVGGRRPYPTWLRVASGTGWLVVGAGIVALLVGPDPGARLPLFGGALVALWGALAMAAVAVAASVGVGAWRTGRSWADTLARSEVRLRMNGGLTLIGASAGLPFCLDTLLALYRARPAVAGGSWLWRRIFRRLHADAGTWAATGVVTVHGGIRPVVLEPKLRACLQRAGVRHILTPRQREATPRAVGRVRDALPPATRARVAGPSLAPDARLGFASEPAVLRSHACRHVAQSLLTVGGLSSAWQMATTALAVVASAVMLAAAPSLRGLLLPPPAPAVVGPASPSPYFLWVSLATTRPDDFVVELESGFWANRRAVVTRYPGEAPRVELRLRRLGRQTAFDVEDGTVSVVRRHRFLWREFVPGERVGHYSFSYLTRLGNE